MFSRRRFIQLGVSSVVVVAAAPKLIRGTEAERAFATGGELLPTKPNPVVAAMLDRHFFIALHTAAPSDHGDQSSNEVTYRGYVRQRIPRHRTEWAMEGGTVYNVNPIMFPQALETNGESIAHFSMGGNVAGRNPVFVYGSLERSLPICLGTQFKFDKRSLEITF